jgi:hypothetical protein
VQVLCPLPKATGASQLVRCRWSRRWGAGGEIRTPDLLITSNPRPSAVLSGASIDATRIAWERKPPSYLLWVTGCDPSSPRAAPGAWMPSSPNSGIARPRVAHIGRAP